MEQNDPTTTAPSDPTSQQAIANVPPATVIGPGPETQHRHELNIDHPGHIKYASQKDGGRYVGCLLAIFSHTDEVNEFFRLQSNLVVIEMWPYRSDDQSRVNWYVLYTNQLEREEMELYLELQDAYNKVKADLFREREVKARADEAKMDAEEKELAKFVALGKKCESNHGKLEKMSQQIDALSERVSKYESKYGDTPE